MTRGKLNRIESAKYEKENRKLAQQKTPFRIGVDPYITICGGNERAYSVGKRKSPENGPMDAGNKALDNTEFIVFFF